MKEDKLISSNILNGNTSTILEIN